MCAVQSENLDNSMDHSDVSAVSHDADDDKSLVLQYEGQQHVVHIASSHLVVSILQQFN